jgi:predicted Zn-dependent protease
MKAQFLYYQAIDYIYTSQPNLYAAQRLLSESVALDPRAFFVAIELGNVDVQLGDRNAAVTAYSLARQYAFREEDKRSLAEQIARASSDSGEPVPPMRNPEVE